LEWCTPYKKLRSIEKLHQDPRKILWRRVLCRGEHTHQERGRVWRREESLEKRETERDNRSECMMLYSFVMTQAS
jgi:hypothetical protein